MQGVSRFLLVLAVALLSEKVTAAPIYSGDMNMDGVFDATDIVNLINTLNDPDFDTLFGLDLLILDANQDGFTDGADVTWIAEIILGLRNPLPIEGMGLSAQVSLWLPPEASEVTESDAVLHASVSLWNVPETPVATDADAVHPGPVGFWLQPEVPEATEVDAVQQGTPSFDLQS